MFYITVDSQKGHRQGRSVAYLVSISFPVSGSVMISRTHGGGVIGRRSYIGQPRVKSSRKQIVYFVSKATHTSSLWLLHDL